MPEPTLADTYLAGLSDPRRFASFHDIDPRGMSRDVRRKVERARRRDMQDMRGAHRFVLDASAVDVLHEVVYHLTPRQFLRMMRRARLPFENMWVEFDHQLYAERVHKKLSEIQVAAGETPGDMGPVPRRWLTGFHLQAVDPDLVSVVAVRDYAGAPDEWPGGVARKGLVRTGMGMLIRPDAPIRPGELEGGGPVMCSECAQDAARLAALDQQGGET